MAKNADKALVKETLIESLNYCNSHHMPVQTMFESLVDELINESTCQYSPELRRTEMKSLFPILFQKKTEKMIPSIPMKVEMLELEPDEFAKAWLRKWIGKFLSEWKSLPSDHIADAKKTVTDPALLHMVMSGKHAGSLKKAEEWAAHHNLFMSAENAGGNLLEEYIASKISSYGWIWCRGKILTAIDFCNLSCDAMFQVKNKTNTENSSGKGFRESCGAVAWCRMRAELRNGSIETYWPDLVEIVKAGSTDPDKITVELLNENDYLQFVADVAEKNPGLITDREGNYL